MLTLGKIVMTGWYVMIDWCHDRVSAKIDERSFERLYPSTQIVP